MSLENAQPEVIESESSTLDDGFEMPNQNTPVSETEFYDEDEGEEGEEPESEGGDQKAPKTAETAENKPEEPVTSSDPWDTLDRDSKADLLDIARRMGMSETEAKQWTPNGLKINLQKRIDQQLAAQRAQHQQQQAPQQKQADPFKFDLEPLKNDLDPQLYQQLQGFHDSQQQTIQALQQQIAQQEQWRQQYTQEQAQIAFDARTERFESKVGSLISSQPELEKLLGKGTIHDLREGSVEYENRRRLFDEFQRQNPGNGMAPPLGEGRAFEKALDATFGKELREIEKQKLADEMRKNAKRATARPNSGHSRAGDGLKRALAISKEFDRKLG